MYSIRKKCWDHFYFNCTCNVFSTFHKGTNNNNVGRNGILFACNLHIGIELDSQK